MHRAWNTTSGLMGVLAFIAVVVASCMASPLFSVSPAPLRRSFPAISQFQQFGYCLSTLLAGLEDRVAGILLPRLARQTDGSS